jgi:hypothetical protein
VPAETVSRPGRWRDSAAVLGLYAGTSIALFGWPLWPHPGRDQIGVTPDREIFIWSLAWWAHALTTFTNPFVTNVVYHPVGVNLMWTASGQGLGLLLTPLTLLVGPTAAYNVAMIVLPALGAWTAFLLCRYVSGSLWGSVVGGYLFGFSSYVIAHIYGGDPNLCVFLTPLLALATLRFVRGELSPAGLVWRAGPILAFQYMVSTELFLTMTLALACGLALGFALVPGSRRPIARTLAPIGLAYAVAAVLAAPFVYYTLTNIEKGAFVQYGDDDLLSFVVPTPALAAGGQLLTSVTHHIAGAFTDDNVYIGIPTLLILGLYGWRRRRDGAARFLVVSFVLVSILALGSTLHVYGHEVSDLPWHLVASLPLIGNVVAQRLIEYALLPASVAVSLWVASTRGSWLARPVVLPALALVSILPATWHVSFASSVQRPGFFSQKLYKLCIPKGETLLVFPYGRFGDSMLYQAESGFWFKLAEGNLGRDTWPPKFVFASPTVESLQFNWYGPEPLPTMAALKAYARLERVDRIITLVSSPYPSGEQMHAFGPLQGLGDVLVAPACGYDSLAGDRRRIPGQ